MSPPPTTFEALHAQYGDDVYRFAFWLSGNAHDAADLASETFIRAWAGTDTIQLESVKAYLFTICRNLHRKNWRKRSREVNLEEAITHLPDTAHSPAAQAATHEELQRTLEAMKQLSESDRTLLLLRAQGGLSYAEIASSTGLSEAAAKVKVFRARAKLSSLLNPPPYSQP